MPNVPQYDWTKLQPAKPEKQNTHGTMDFQMVQFFDTIKQSKHHTTRVATPPKNQPLSVFDCSRCGYAATSRKDLNDHWVLEHD